MGITSYTSGYFKIETVIFMFAYEEAEVDG